MTSRMPFARRTRAAAVATLVLGCALGSAGCARTGSPDLTAGSQTGAVQPSYTPRPDADLFAAIAALPSVTSSEVSYTDNVTHGTQYRGTIYVDGSVAPVRVLDQANAILWQGRPAHIVVQVVKGTRTSGSLPVTQEALGLDLVGLQADAAFAQRYGARPGTGQPPATSP